ncbi:MAG: hypothetical protein ACRBBN_11205, partial [Methyloligellaceae bacterium]
MSKSDDDKKLGSDKLENNTDIDKNKTEFDEYTVLQDVEEGDLGAKNYVINNGQSGDEDIAAANPLIGINKPEDQKATKDNQQDNIKLQKKEGDIDDDSNVEKNPSERNIPDEISNRQENQNQEVSTSDSSANTPRSSSRPDDITTSGDDNTAAASVNQNSQSAPSPAFASNNNAQTQETATDSAENQQETEASTDEEGGQQQESNENAADGDSDSDDTNDSDVSSGVDDGGNDSGDG